ncbi:MAG TPA: hypothetical protein VF522_01070 [Ramlibacter sp.]|uniref:hypothetical protein n=1 Tax=Ramlibacter sp. TaxID=1917967 RepID=UPI002ED32EA9
MQQVDPTRGVPASTSTSRLLFPVSCAAGSIALLAWLLKYSHYGVDLTDEAYYLVWIANPFLYDVSVHLFGFVYHPIYRLLQGDIAALRQANILVTFALAWLVVALTLGRSARGAIDSRLRVALSFGFASGALLLVDNWLPSPSYNSLAQQALLLTVSGLLLADRELHRTSVAGWLLVAIGGWLTFMGKPSTAAALAVCAPVYLFAAGKMNWRMLIVTGIVAAALVVLSALAIDGSLGAFARRLGVGMEYLAHLQGGHTVQNILRLDRFQLNAREKALLAVAAPALCVAGLCLQRWRPARPFGLVACAMLLAAVLLLVSGVRLPDPRLGVYKDLLIAAVAFAAIGLAVVAPGNLLGTLRRGDWALAILFLVLPHVYAFGTNGNYWQAAGAAGLFWAMAGVVLLVPTLAGDRWATLVPLALGTQAIVALVIYSALLAPYRQPEPLWTNRTPVEFGAPGSRLVLSQDNARYVERALSGARQAGFTPGTPVIDLTGQSPGLLYALRAMNVGHPWIVGGWPGSAPFTQAHLRHVPCKDLARAWLLTEPRGPRSVTGEVLAPFGLDVGRDYQVVGSWETAPGAGGYAQPRLQVLMKPLRPDDIAGCARATAGGLAHAPQ